ncbi:MAG: peptidylprolyl isomerase [Bacteroidetes bacterium]|nr:MAG: peptidylprolyl isomerase [Bacteroidota bacterium]
MKRFLLLIGALMLVQISFGQEKEMLVEITTDYGAIVVKLYNDTPYHRDNFIELVKKEHYNGTDFQRVIKDFMIQGGGSKSYTLPAEILPKYIHKKGALAAARMPDQVNPEKRSSGCQFYIVEGKVYPRKGLEMFAERSKLKYTEEQLKTYETIGGTPFLDGEYTVFGEVVMGLEVVEKISVVKTGRGDKPLKPIIMKMKILDE